jgi:hypothetical protein
METLFQWLLPPRTGLNFYTSYDSIYFPLFDILVVKMSVQYIF